MKNTSELSEMAPISPNCVHYHRIRQLENRTVVGYLGNMNPQDGVENLLMAAKEIIHNRGRKDFYFCR